MFNGDLNVHIDGEQLIIQFTKVSVMHEVEHTISLFFNDVSKIPVVNQMITAHKAIYKIFGSGIYHKPHYMFKSKSYEFHNSNIGLFSRNYTRMAGCFIGMQIYLRTRKVLLATVSYAEFATMALNSKLYKVVSYIQCNKSWERIYVVLKLLFTRLQVLCLAHSTKSGMEMVFYSSRFTKIFIIKSSYDIDNKEL